jgi:competence ComEA-like helix-hairpin-helix protein
MPRGSIFRGPVGFTPVESKIAAGIAIVVLIGAGYTAVDRLSRPAPRVHFEQYTLPVEAEYDMPGPPAADVERNPVPQASWTQGRLNLNTADYAELLRLPGIGPVLARRIIDYRDRHGPFAAIDSLLQVSGIGEVKLEKLRPHMHIPGAGE